MLCTCSPRRWAIVRSALFTLVCGSLGLAGLAQAGARSQEVLPHQASSHASELGPSGDPIVPIIANLPFQRSASGELLPDPDSVKSLLAESVEHPGRLLVIRPTGALVGFDRGMVAGDLATASDPADEMPAERSMLEDGSAALLRVIEAVRRDSPGTHVSILGLPIERSRLADEAAMNGGPYARLLGDLDAFVSTRGLLQGSDAVNERAWMKSALPSAVRFAHGRPILYRTPAGWQQRSLPIEPLEGHDNAFAGDSVEAGRTPDGAPAARIAEHSKRPLDEAGLPATGTIEDSFARRAAESDRPSLEAPAFSGGSDRFDWPSDPDGATDPSAESLADARLSDSGGTILDDGEVADPGAIVGDEPLPALERETSGGGAAAPPSRSLAIVPRALRTFAPLAIGGDLLDPRGFRSATRGESPAAEPAPGLKGSSARSSSAPSLRSGAPSSSSRPASSGSSAAATAPAGSKGSAAAPSAPAAPRSAGSSAVSASAPATRSPTTTPSRPTPPPAPPVLPANISTTGSGSSPPSVPPPLDPVIPITPPVSSGSSSSTSSPASTQPTTAVPPRDWSSLPANVGNAASRIGSHAPAINYYGSDVAFTNLIYASVSDPASLVRGLNGQGKMFFGSERYLDWTGPAYYSRDGWPFRSDAGPLSRSNAVPIALSWGSDERMWSILGLRGGFAEPPAATLDENGRKATYPAPLGITGRSFSFKATCFWEGQGTAVVGRGQLPATPQVQTVEFTGPQGQGPFGDGPRTMRSSTVQFTASGDSPGGLLAYIIESDPTGADPLRNLIVLISDVRDTATGEIIYAGFDHRTYRPFQLYPDWVESMRHCSHLRSLHNDFARGTPTADLIIHEDTGLEYEWHMDSHGSTHLLSTGWSRLGPSAPGFDRGFAAINRPTHVGFGNSLRAIIELCNQLDADLWWCHPAPTVFVGSRSSNGTPIYARLRGETPGTPNQVGSILIDEAYARGFTDEISAHLKPGLRVYSEWVNEIWNGAPAYVWATRYAWTCAMRAVAPVEYGGDGGLWFAKRKLTAPAIHAGVDLKADANTAMTAFSAAASARLVEAIRARLGPDSDREVVCVAAGQSNWPARSAGGLGQFWAAMPYLFKHLDAVAHAPYRDPILVWPHNSVESDRNLVEDLATARGAWDAYEAAGMLTSPLAESSWWTTAMRDDNLTNLTHGNFRSWKHLAIDLPLDLGTDRRNSYYRTFLPPQWPDTQRRWNLDLLTYESGTHTLPGNKASDYATPARLLMFSVVLEPRNSRYYQRYLETAFMMGPKGLVRDPASAREELLYRRGMVPMGVAQHAEPLHDRFTFLVTTSQPSFRFGMFWSLQWWNGHLNAPPALGVAEYLRTLTP